MTKATCSTCNVISRCLSEIRMSDYDRRAAAQAMRGADAIAHAVTWAKDTILSLGTALPKLVLKH